MNCAPRLPIACAAMKRFSMAKLSVSTSTALPVQSVDVSSRAAVLLCLRSRLSEDRTVEVSRPLYTSLREGFPTVDVLLRCAGFSAFTLLSLVYGHHLPANQRFRGLSGRRRKTLAVGGCG